MPKHNALGAIEGYVATRFEITELMNVRDRLRSLAATDPLTGLFNRGGFNTVLQAAVDARAQDIARPIWLVMFDLDGFKQVNDIHGHHAGDVVLKVIGRRLREIIHPKMLPAGWAGMNSALSSATHLPGSRPKPCWSGCWRPLRPRSRLVAAPWSACPAVWG